MLFKKRSGMNGIIIAALLLAIGCVFSSMNSSAHAGETSVAQGWSHGEDDSLKAIASAGEMLRKNLGGNIPKAIFFSATSMKLDIPEMVKSLGTQFPDVPIWGGSSALGMFMNNDLGYMKGNAVGLLALTSDDYKFFIEGAEVDGGEDNWIEAVNQVVGQAKAFEKGAPDLVLFTSNPGPHEDRIIEELKKNFGRLVPIFGGASGAESPSPRYCVASRKVFAKGFSLALIYTSKKLGYCYQMGFRAEKVRGIVTKSDGRWLYEIDGKPSLQVYNQWADGLFSELIRNDKPIRGESQMLCPLAVVRKDMAGNEFYVTLSAMDYSKENGGINFAVSLEEGDEVTVMKGDLESLIDRTHLGIMKAKKMARGRIAGGLVFFCTGARLLLENKGRTGELAPQLKRAFLDKPFMMMFNSGEHGSIPSSESFHGNLMFDAVVFGE